MQGRPHGEKTGKGENWLKGCTRCGQCWKWRDPFYCTPFHILGVPLELSFRMVVCGRVPVCQQLGPLLQLCPPHTGGVQGGNTRQCTHRRLRTPLASTLPLSAPQQLLEAGAAGAAVGSGRPPGAPTGALQALQCWWMSWRPEWSGALQVRARGCKLSCSRPGSRDNAGQCCQKALQVLTLQPHAPAAQHPGRADLPWPQGLTHVRQPSAELGAEAAAEGTHTTAEQGRTQVASQ